MFLKKTIKKNKSLIKYAFELHQNKIIAPNTFVIDLDALLDNAKKILNIAQSNNIDLLYLPNQFSHLPIIAKKLEATGYYGTIASDYSDFKTYQANQIKVRSIGYYSQIPNIILEEIVNSNLDFLTVYSVEKLRKINSIAKANNKYINIVIRVIDQEKDIILDNQSGGFLLKDLANIVKSIKNLHNIKIIGITSFPCFIYHWEINQKIETPNFFTLKKAQVILQDLGISNTKLLIPTADLFESNSFIALINSGEEYMSLKGLAQLGNDYNDNQATPSIVYVSEVSHNYNAQAYIFSNKVGFNCNLVASIVGDKITNYHRYDIQTFRSKNSTNYLTLNKSAKVGNTVILAFDWQMTTHKSQVAVISGLQKNEPQILGIYNCSGALIV